MQVGAEPFVGLRTGVAQFNVAQFKHALTRCLTMLGLMPQPRLRGHLHMRYKIRL
jgi:hypothetical protein